MTDDEIVATFRDPSFSVAAEDIAALAEAIGRAACLDQPYDAYAVQMVVEHTAAAYRATQWMASQGDLGPDTLDQVGEPLHRLLDLLTHGLNRDRLTTQFVIEAYGGTGIKGAKATFDAYEAMLALLAAIPAAAERAHRGRARGRPVRHPELNAAFRVALGHFNRMFGVENLLGRRAWTETTPPQPRHLSAIFIFGVIKLVAPDRERLATELRTLMVRALAALPGPRPGRAYQ
jgi:hypothetical protein